MVQSGPTEMDETQGAIMDTPKDNPAPAPEPPTVPYSWQKFVPRPTLHYITSQDEANLKVSELKPGPFGFDLEWKPTFIKGQPQNRVALVQLANNETILLIQVSAMRSNTIPLSQLCWSPNSRCRLPGEPQRTVRGFCLYQGGHGDTKLAPPVYTWLYSFIIPQMTP